MKHHILQSTTPVNEKQLNELAAEGWIFVTALRFGDIYYWYFRKEFGSGPV